MKLHRKFALIVAMLALAGMLASTANAQTAVVAAKDARFTLPFTANWQGTVLPPGDYRLTVTEISNAGVLSYRIDFGNTDRKHSILAFTTSGMEAGKQSMLVAESRGSTFSIRELHLPKANLVLTFPVGKTKMTELAKNHEDGPAVPIQIALK